MPLKKLTFKDFVFSVDLERVQLSNGEYRSKGQTYNQILILNKNNNFFASL